MSVAETTSVTEHVRARVLAELREHRRVITGHEDFLLEHTIDRFISDIEDPYGESIIPDLLGPHVPADGNVASYITVQIIIAAAHLALSERAPQVADLLSVVRERELTDAEASHFGDIMLNTIYQHSEHFQRFLARGLQKNVPERARVLYPVELLAAQESENTPLQILEIGASAGLALIADRYRYRYDGKIFGNPGSHTIIDDEWGDPGDRHEEIHAFLAQQLPEKITRKGCDLSPIDITNGRDYKFALAQVAWAPGPKHWGEAQAAIKDANGQANLLSIIQCDAEEWLTEQLLAADLSGRTTIVFSSITERYYPKEKRRNIREIIAEAGANATTANRLYYARFDCPDTAKPFEQELAVESYPGPRKFSVPASGVGSFSLVDFHRAAFPMSRRSSGASRSP